MNRFARTAAFTSLKVQDIERPFSLFNLVDVRFGFLTTLRRVLSQVRAHNARTMVIEELASSDDLRQENEDIRIRYPDARASHAVRLSFFTKRFSTQRALFGIDPEDFVGYAIVKLDQVPSRFPVGRWRVYESVLRPSRHANNYIRGTQSWHCRIGGTDLNVNGYLYAQQNNMTNVCAHVALRTAAARFHPAGDMSYREMNTLVGIDHKTRKVGGPDGKGMSSDEMVEILEKAGGRCFLGSYTKPEAWPVPFDKYLYGSVESGFPAIVIFGTVANQDEYHAIPVFGHTFNEDMWVASAEFSYFRVGAGTAYIPSDSWLSMYVGHDDNWGSNYCIPRRYLDTKRVCELPGSRRRFCASDKKGVAFVIGTVPSCVKLNPVRAEVIGADYLFTIFPQMPNPDNQWRVRLERFAKDHMLILRPILIRGEEYVEHLNKVRDWEGNRVEPSHLAALRKNLTKDLLWMIELSVPELFSTNRRKVGEVLLRSDIDAGATRDFTTLLLARVPGNFALYEGGGAANPRYRFIPSGLGSHIELFGCEKYI